MARNISVSVTDSSGSTIGIPADVNRNEVYIENLGPDSVYLAFNEDALVEKGTRLKIDGSLVVTGGVRATANIHFICDTGETATVIADITPN